MISSIFLVCFVCFWEKAMLMGRRHHLAVQHGGNDLAPNNNEAVDVGMEEDPEKILPLKYVGSKDLFFFFLLVKERRGRSDTGERPILLKTSKLWWRLCDLSLFLLNFPPGLNFTFFRVANRYWYSSRRSTIVPVLSESAAAGQSAHHRRSSRKISLDRVHQFHIRSFAKFVGELAFDGHERLSRGYHHHCQGLRN